MFKFNKITPIKLCWLFIIDRTTESSLIKEKIISQVKLKFEIFKSTDIPEKLRSIKPIKPGSRNLY